VNDSPDDKKINGQILRLIDANFNRAREALRVVEDFFRFIQNDRKRSARAKQFRHELTTTLAPVIHVAQGFRDTAADVGTEISTETEMTRSDAIAVLIANCKRVGESLRVIEEYTKTFHAEIAGEVEQLRYQFYDFERDVLQSARQNSHFAGVNLYVIVTESICKKFWVAATREALEGGARILQLREKNLDSRELLERAKKFVELCKDFKAISIINDRADIAMLSDADGVHVGQTDLSVRDVRKIIGSKIVGVSTSNLELAKQAELDGADYIGIGPIFPSTTKPKPSDEVAGLEVAREVAREISIPTYAISGITTENVGQLIDVGIKRVAVSSGVLSQVDVRKSARELSDRLA